MKWPTEHTKYMKEQEIDYMIRDYDFPEDVINKVYDLLQDHYLQYQEKEIAK